MKQKERFVVLLTEEASFYLNQIKEILKNRGQDSKDYRVLESSLRYYYDFLKNLHF